ncbi:hypothetical protein INR49_028817, partial [Caranx melampygus]
MWDPTSCRPSSCSTPSPGGNWTEVTVKGAWKSVISLPPLHLSNRYTVLNDGAPDQPGDNVKFGVAPDRISTGPSPDPCTVQQPLPPREPAVESREPLTQQPQTYLPPLWQPLLLLPLLCLRRQLLGCTLQLTTSGPHLQPGLEGHSGRVLAAPSSTAHPLSEIHRPALLRSSRDNTVGSGLEPLQQPHQQPMGPLTSTFGCLGCPCMADKIAELEKRISTLYKIQEAENLMDNSELGPRSRSARHHPIDTIPPRDGWLLAGTQRRKGVWMENNVLTETRKGAGPERLDNLTDQSAVAMTTICCCQPIDGLFPTHKRTLIGRQRKDLPVEITTAPCSWSGLMETTGVCELDVATRRIVGGSDSPPELDSLCQEDVGEFDLGLCCAEEERGETPGREDSPSDLGEAELDPGGKEVILLMQALNSLTTPEEKLAALCKKYADL